MYPTTIIPCSFHTYPHSLPKKIRTTNKQNLLANPSVHDLYQTKCFNCHVSSFILHVPFCTIFPTSPSHICQSSSIEGCDVSCNIPFLHKQFCLQNFIAVNRWSGSGPLASATSSILDLQVDSSWIFCCCPQSERLCSCGFTAPTPSSDPAAHRWGGPTQSLESSLGWQLS